MYNFSSCLKIFFSENKIDFKGQETSFEGLDFGI